MARFHHPDHIYERRWLILAVLNLSLVIVVAGNSSLNVALPTLQRDLQASGSELQWIVDAYALVFAGLLLPMGALGDRYGRKGLLQVGLATFAVGALVATMATEPWHLVAMRALMGVGAAMIMPATLSLLTNVFPPQERAKAIAIWAGFAGAGASVGPLTSGFLLEHFWYGSVFFLNVPIIATALLAGALLVPSSRDPAHRALDPVGSVLSMAGLGALLYGIIQAPEHGWGDPVIVGAFVMAAAVLVAFVAWERRSDHPMLPIEQFSDRRFSVGAVAIMFNFFAMFGLFFVATQYLQFVLGYSPLKAGAATLPMALMMVFWAPRTAKLSERHGRSRVMAGGSSLIALGMVAMATLGANSAYWPLAGALLLLGSGMAMAMAPATGAIMESMPLAKAGVGSAVNDTTREVGASLGVAILGSLLSSGYRGALDVDLTHLSAPARDLARDSVGAALAVARQLPGPLGDALATASREAFADAMSVVFLAAAFVATLTAVFVFRTMPGRGMSHPGAAPDEGVGEWSVSTESSG